MMNQKNDHQQHDHGCAAGTDDGQPGDRFLHRPDQAEALIAVLYGKDQIAAVLGVETSRQLPSAPFTMTRTFVCSVSGK